MGININNNSDQQDRMCININDNSDQQNGCVLMLMIIMIICIGVY